MQDRIFSVIHSAELADLSSFRYTQIYGGNLGCSVEINGTQMVINPSDKLNIHITQINGGVGCFVLGEPIKGRGLLTETVE